MKFLWLFFCGLILYGCNNSSGYQVPDYERMADGITSATAQKIERETALRLIGTGGGAIDHIRKLNMSFEYLGEMSVDQARELLVYCVDGYLSAINEHEQIRPHLIHYPFTPNDVEITIFISQRDRRKVPVGALAVVSERKGVLNYDTRQEGTNFTKTIHEETYEEAFKIVEAGEAVHRPLQSAQLTERT